MEKQHVQVPNGMELPPKDQLIYAVLKEYEDGKSNETFVSLQTISTITGASIPTIRASIERLKDKGYISTRRDGRRTVYKFEKYINFEPFHKDFLENKDVSFASKAYILASQQYMFKDIQGVGKIGYSNRQLSNKINMPESTIRKCDKELENKNYLTILKNEIRDLETGCFTNTKIFKLGELGQAIIWTLKNHEDRINENTENIEDLKNNYIDIKDKYNDMKDKVESQQKLIEALLRAQNIEPDKFIV